jgi:hypothetical protein
MYPKFYTECVFLFFFTVFAGQTRSKVTVMVFLHLGLNAECILGQLRLGLCTVQRVLRGEVPRSFNRWR